MNVVYNASPTLSAFHLDDSFVRGVMGPVGSGKSVACCMEIVSRASRQEPGHDGKRRSRWAIVRNTYGELFDTTWKTWSAWFPPGVFGEFNKSEFTFLFKHGDIEAELLFRALDRPEHVAKLLSLELTGAWINEAREVPKAILDGLTMRVGRYPSKQDGGCAWTGILMDTNPPDEDHWWYRMAEEATPVGWRFFRQPGGLRYDRGDWLPNELAENIDHLDGGYEYYLRQVPGKSHEWVQTYLGGQYGVVGTGRPVYPEYNDLLHAAPSALKPVPGSPLYLGWDFGLTPAAVLGQVTARGQLLILREWCADSMGIRQFARDVVKPDLARDYPGYQITSVGDPAGNQRAQTDQRSCLQELAALGLPTSPSHTNAFVPRREAVAGFLTGLVDGRARMQLDPSCNRIRRGFLGKYYFERVKVSGDERFKDQPCKNMYSHCLVGGTRVSTPDGSVTIDALRVGDVVETPIGAKRVTAVMSRPVTELYEVGLSNKIIVLCTGEHPFILPGGKTFARDLAVGGVVIERGSQEEREWADRQNTLSKSSRESVSTGNARATISPISPRPGPLGTCIEWFGNFITGRSLAGMWSTMLTAIGRTMRSGISLSCHYDRTLLITGANGQSVTLSVPQSIWPLSGPPRLNGIAPKREGRGIAITGRGHGKGASRVSWFVSNAAWSMRRFFRSAASVLCRASNALVENLASMMRIGPVRFAGSHSAPTNTPRNTPALRIAAVNLRRLSAPVKVYDLTVEDAHCFYAEGVLVSNCHDALQYLCMRAQAAKADDTKPKARPRRAYRPGLQAGY